MAHDAKQPRRSPVNHAGEANSPTADFDFAELFRVHGPAIRRYVARRWPSAVEDITAEVFLVAWRRRDEVPASPLPWLYRVAFNIVATTRRQHHYGLALASRVANASIVAGQHIERDIAERVAEADLLARLFAELAPEDAELLLLLAWEGLTPSDAARVLGLRPAVLYLRTHRARRRFRQLAAIARVEGERRG